MLFSIFVGNFVFAQSSDYTVGKIQFPDRCYSSVGTGTVIIDDSDMNKDPKQAESVPIHLWSSRDVDIRTPNAIETGNNTGIFEATVFFNMYDEAFSQRIRVFEGDTLHAKYVDTTVPFGTQQEIETFVVIGTLPPDQKWGKYWESLSPSKDSKYVYDTCMAEFVREVKPTDHALNNLDIIYPAPLKQIDSGLLINEIRCKDNLERILKYSGLPACVTEPTKQKLIERGWTNFTPIKPEVGKFGTYELNQDGKTFDVKYHIQGGADIKEIVYDSDVQTIEIVLEMYDNAGLLDIAFAHKLFDSILHEDTHDLFFVLVDGQETEYNETTNETTRTLTIPFDRDSKIIKIIGARPI